MRPVKQRVWIGRLLCVVSLCLLGGCPIGPASRSSSGGGGGGGGSTFGPIQFQMPAPDSTVDAPFTVSASGPGILRVFFSVDTTPLLEDWTAPFEVTIDPLTLSKGAHTVSAIAEAPSGEEQMRAVQVIVVRPRPSVAEMHATIAALEGGRWYEIPETPMADVQWRAPPGENDRGPVADHMECASGAALDTKRNRLVVWGGGCSSSRNEIYCFDFDDLVWVRLNEPSPLPTVDGLTHSDGAPAARHSYDMIEYLPERDQLYMGGGTVFLGGFFFDEHYYLFDFTTGTWSRSAATHRSSGISISAAVAPDGRVWQHGGESEARLSVIDPDADQATTHADWGGFMTLGYPAEIDSVRNRYVLVGGGAVRYWDLSQPDDSHVEQPTSGDTEIVDATRLGLVYLASRDRFVAWAGGKDVYVLDPSTWVWTRIAGQGDVDPGPPTSRGVFGRWRYVPSIDCFCIVTGVDKNVFVYRLP